MRPLDGLENWSLNIGRCASNLYDLSIHIIRGQFLTLPLVSPFRVARFPIKYEADIEYYSPKENKLVSKLTFQDWNEECT